MIHSLFDQLVNEALKHQANTTLAPVVEKELLHHDILRELSRAGLLKNLTFMGGTCLRACYGAERLSEDLDFTAGKNFSKEELSPLAQVLEKRLMEKYSLPVKVSEPHREQGNTKTWKIKIETRPDRADFPSQKIHLDICAVPSYDIQPKVLIQHHGVDMGTSGLIINCESREEILLDKLIAFTLRPNRIKNRDLWDVAWLKQQGCKVPFHLSHNKISDHEHESEPFIHRCNQRLLELKNESCRHSFQKEMLRFLPLTVTEKTLAQEGFWEYIVSQMEENCTQLILSLRGGGMGSVKFPMG